MRRLFRPFRIGVTELENRRFYAEKMGDIVTQRLRESFEDLLDYGFTASMEENLMTWPRVAKIGVMFLIRFMTISDRNLISRSVPGLAVCKRMSPRPRGSLVAPAAARCSHVQQALGYFYALATICHQKERCKSTGDPIPGMRVVSADADDEAESRCL